MSSSETLIALSFARQHQIEDDQIEPCRSGPGQRRLTVADGLALQPLEAEVQHDQVPDMRVVFHNQYTGHDEISVS